MRTSDELKAKQKELAKRLLKIHDKIEVLQVQEGAIRNALQNIENALYKNESIRSL